MVDTLLIIFGALCMVAGITGCILPVLPGPPISYAGLLLLQFSSKHPFNAKFLVIYALLTVFVVILDFILPVYSTKKFRGTKYGIIGSALGLVVGLFLFPPVGIIVGPIVGAFIGEMITGRAIARAMKPAFGSFIGFLGSTSIKLILTIIMAYHFVINVF
jgi:uncharacterized protein YqgC (DUF456 family)